MSKPTIRIHNIETNEIIDREMTDSEFAQYEVDQAIETARQTEAEAKAEAKAAAQAKLAALGLTISDLEALGL
ncbi:MAG: hypothetical protein KGR70_16935 [Cyanobacteria bacterium REEB494]|nr:hypothetical protein [Cyanobacteria bacterium REEB494]